MLALVLAASLQATWFVDASGTAPGSGTAADPYTSVTYALAQASTTSGDTVLVRPGRYLNEAIDFDGKSVTLLATGDASDTFLIGRPFGPDPRSVLTLDQGESGVVIEGFTVDGVAGPSGVWTQSSFAEVGAGLLCINGSSATVRRTIFTNGDLSFAGSGVFALDSSLVLEDTSFMGCGGVQRTNRGAGLYAENCLVSWDGGEAFANVVDFRGGGAYLQDCSTTLEDIEFRSNSGFYSSGLALGVDGGTLAATGCSFRSHSGGDPGAAVRLNGAPDVRFDQCDFVNNFNGNADPYAGGAIYTQDGSLTLTDCDFQGNVGQFGGAIQSFAPITATGCRFLDNTATGLSQYGSHGGALSLLGGGTLTQCFFEGNRAISTFSDGGGAIHGAAIIDRCTFVGNEANPGDSSTISGNSGSTLSNSIVRGGTSALSAACTATYCNVEGGFAGAGNFDSDPEFWSTDPMAPDYRLLPGSPCIDSGDPATPVDADGTRVDVGAFPFDSSVGDVIGVTTCTAFANSTGLGASLEARGSDFAADDRVTLHVTDSSPGTLGYFLASENGANTTLGGGSQGRLCLGGQILRFSLNVLDDRGTQTVSFHPRLAELPQGTVAMAGDTWIFQYWFRDANPGATSNTSDAVSVTLR